MQRQLVMQSKHEVLTTLWLLMTSTSIFYWKFQRWAVHGGSIGEVKSPHVKYNTHRELKYSWKKHISVGCSMRWF